MLRNSLHEPFNYLWCFVVDLNGGGKRPIRELTLRHPSSTRFPELREASENHFRSKKDPVPWDLADPSGSWRVFSSRHYRCRAATRSILNNWWLWCRKRTAPNKCIPSEWNGEKLIENNALLTCRTTDIWADSACHLGKLFWDDQRVWSSIVQTDSLRKEGFFLMNDESL